MDKLVILKSIGGSFEQGFQCSLSIAHEGQPVAIEVLGTLPAQPMLPDDYAAWQAAYRSLGLRTRISGSGVVRKGTSRSDCVKAATHLKTQLDLWLRSPTFSPIRDKIQEQLQPDDRVRLILQIDDRSLQQLPWHAWELLDRYHRIEIALATPSYQAIQAPKLVVKPVRILAILGDATGIDIEADRVFLEALPNAEVTFLVAPERRALTDQLWERGWDILFFAGHSITQDGGDACGYVYINPVEKLSITDLKYALRRSVEQGLQLAIFNSCDGFGLARNLADLHIPQTIFMREPVPDPVAQAFLKHFLTAYVQDGESLYLAVRSARERLETSESEFLYASWLPMIFQNLAVMPKSWKALGGQDDRTQSIGIPGETPSEILGEIHPTSVLQSRVKSWAKSLAIVGLSGIVSTGLVSWVRHQGWLQPLELRAYDHLMQVASKLDSQKIQSPTLVITIDDDDKRRYGNPNEDLSVSAENLVALIQKLNAANAEVIAVDLIRDTKGLPLSLTEPLRKMDNLIGGCLHPSDNNPGLKVPQGIDRQVGFFDMAQDPDKGIRRNLLTFFPNHPEMHSPICSATSSIAVVATAKFLKFTPQELVAKLPLLDGKHHPGAYQQSDERNSLMQPQDYAHLLIHYRSDRISTMSMGDFMNDRSGKVQLDGKIVFIGVTRNSASDYHVTPLNPRTPGVFVHVEKTNHLLRLIQDREAAIWVWSEKQEWAWICFWAIASGMVVAVGWRSSTAISTAISTPMQSDIRTGITTEITTNLAIQFLKFSIGVSSVVLLLYGSCVILWMQQSGWVPLVPSVGSIVLTAVCTTASLAQASRTRSQTEPKILRQK